MYMFVVNTKIGFTKRFAEFTVPVVCIRSTTCVYRVPLRYYDAIDSKTLI